MASKWLVALKQPEQAHTGFEVALERQHCQFELAVASEQTFRAHSGFEVASEQSFRARIGFEVASEHPF